MVLAASIVGSGELIATTTLGAQVGFAVLWIILVSCAIKPVVQAELGRYTIATGHTGARRLQPRARARAPASAGWCGRWAMMVTLTLLQVGGMYGGVAQVLHLLVPAVPVNAWVGVCFVITLALLLGGGYDRIERFAIVKVGLFTVLTVCAAADPAAPARRRDARRSASRSELRAAGRGPRDGDRRVRHHRRRRHRARDVSVLVRREGLRALRRASATDRAAWAARARGWIRVMHLDILCSLVIYTMATVAFYLLGAGVLHRMGLVPAERDTITVLSNIYTQTLGDWALWLFYVGAVVTLYGTIFASTAAHSRLFADAVRIAGRYPRERCGEPPPLAQPLRRGRCRSCR